MSDRISLDHPTIPYLEVMPTYYVGQQVINDGPDEVWSFAMAQAESGFIYKFLHLVADLLPSDIGATVEPGDSPGADPYVMLPLVGEFRYGETPWIAAYVDFEGTHNYDIVVWDSDFNPVGDAIRVESPTPAELAEALLKVYRVLREPIDKINAMPED